jgi:hypothetical protein
MKQDEQKQEVVAVAYYVTSTVVNRSCSLRQSKCGSTHFGACAFGGVPQLLTGTLVFLCATNVRHCIKRHSSGNRTAFL